VFFSPPLEDLGETYDVRLRLSGKRAVDVPVLTKLFARRLRHYERISTGIAVFFNDGVNLDQNFEYKRSSPHQLFMCRKTGINVLSHGIKNVCRTFFRIVTIHAFDRITDGRTAF